jgi:hypothetical protein
LDLDFAVIDCPGISMINILSINYNHKINAFHNSEDFLGSQASFEIAAFALF